MTDDGYGTTARDWTTSTYPIQGFHSMIERSKPLEDSGGGIGTRESLSVIAVPMQSMI